MIKSNVSISWAGVFFGAVLAGLVNSVLASFLVGTFIEPKLGVVGAFVGTALMSFWLPAFIIFALLVGIPLTWLLVRLSFTKLKDFILGGIVGGFFLFAWNLFVDGDLAGYRPSEFYWAMTTIPVFGAISGAFIWKCAISSGTRTATQQSNPPDSKPASGFADSGS